MGGGEVDSGGRFGRRGGEVRRGRGAGGDTRQEL